MLSSISRCRHWATDTQYARELAGGRREEHHIPERSRRRRQFRFSSKWRGRKTTSGGFSLLAPDAGLTRWDYCEPHRTGGNFKNRAWSHLPSSSFVVVSLQKCSMFTTSVVARSIGGRVVRNVPGLLICLFLLPRGQESTAQDRPALGRTSDTGSHSESRSRSLRRHHAQQQPRNAGSTAEGTRAPRSRNHV